jgi:hypothetical protein
MRQQSISWHPAKKMRRRFSIKQYPFIAFRYMQQQKSLPASTTPASQPNSLLRPKMWGSDNGINPLRPSANLLQLNPLPALQIDIGRSKTDRILDAYRIIFLETGSQARPHLAL